MSGSLIDIWRKCVQIERQILTVEINILKHYPIPLRIIFFKNIPVAARRITSDRNVHQMAMYIQ